MFKKTTILKYIGVAFCVATVIITITACGAKRSEKKPYEEIYNVAIKKPETQVTKIPQSVSSIRTKPPMTAEKLKENYMKDVMNTIKEKKRVNKNKDILFIGNSLTEGMRLTTESENNFISEVGVSIDGLNLKEMENMKFKVAVIHMGTNELGSYDEEHFKKSYKELIDYIYKINPEAKIICGSVPPIANVTEYPEKYNNENAKLYSKYIKDLCEMYELRYLDNTEFFGEELQESWTRDGLHFHGDVYSNWYNFIIEKI